MKVNQLNERGGLGFIGRAMVNDDVVSRLGILQDKAADKYKNILEKYNMTNINDYKKLADNIINKLNIELRDVAEIKANESEDMKIDESLVDAEVMFKGKLNNGYEFRAVKRDTTGMRGTQDKFQMIVVKGNKLIDDLGSHPSLNGAKTHYEKIRVVDQMGISLFK